MEWFRRPKSDQDDMNPDEESRLSDSDDDAPLLLTNVLDEQEDSGEVLAGKLNLASMPQAPSPQAAAVQSGAAQAPASQPGSRPALAPDAALRLLLVQSLTDSLMPRISECVQGRMAALLTEHYQATLKNELAKALQQAIITSEARAREKVMNQLQQELALDLHRCLAEHLESLLSPHADQKP